MAGRYERPVVAPSIEKTFDDYLVHLRVEEKAPKTLTKIELVRRRALALAARRRVRSILAVDLDFIDAYRALPTTAGKRPAVTTTASVLSGGHGSRTRNRFPGTTFPVWPLAIRLPSGRSRVATSATSDIRKF